MAGFEVYHDKTDLDELFEMDFDALCEDALSECGPILQESLQSAVRNSIDHEGDSELAKSIKVRKPKKSRNGAWIINATPTGNSTKKVYKGKNRKRTYPVSNVLKAIWKEYGIQGHQPAKPFLAKATNDAEARCIQIIQDKFNEKAGGK